ncbi:hypothetical protein DUNSADRAFT_5922, partial [Dunaliella salina]
MWGLLLQLDLEKGQHESAAWLLEKLGDPRQAATHYALAGDLLKALHLITRMIRKAVMWEKSESRGWGRGYPLQIQVSGLEELLSESQGLQSRLAANPSSSTTLPARLLLLESRLISLGLAWSEIQLGSVRTAQSAGPLPDLQAFAQIRSDLEAAEAATNRQQEAAHISFCRLLLGRAAWSEAVRECKDLVYNNGAGSGRQGVLGKQDLQDSQLAVAVLGLLRQRMSMEQMVHDTQRVMKSVASSRVGEFVVEVHSRMVLEGNMLFMACTHDPQ